LASFDGANGSGPLGYLVQGIDGNFYGTTFYGGTNGYGTVFEITPEGALTTLYSFCTYTNCTDGANPNAGLVQATDGNLYGSTQWGGVNNDGTIFKISLAGKLTTLHSFGGSDGEAANGGLVQGTDGNFYGTTVTGGANGTGTVFKITPQGALTTLYSFCSEGGCTDGAYPNEGVMQGTDGSFYGSTWWGGYYGYGTVFKITPQGLLSSLHSFDGTDGEQPDGLIQATNGILYGTTVTGGYNYGTVFRITPLGTLTTLYRFCSEGNCSDGAYPYAILLQGTDGNLYGTTTGGGAYCTYNTSCGTIFKITLGGTLTTVHSFCSEANCSDGSTPNGLVQATNGKFYAASQRGGTYNNYGTVFSLDMSLGPFVTFVRSVGKVGQPVEILGQGLTGTTSVSFNGTPATFTVRRDTYLVATVPAGATTGPVTVTTPSGTLTSNVPFRVRP
jgi:uncharacterized repeat protein (TIGR03803 family)